MSGNSLRQKINRKGAKESARVGTNNKLCDPYLSGRRVKNLVPFAVKNYSCKYHRNMLKHLTLPLLAFFFIFSLSAQDKPEKWDVSNPGRDWNFKEHTLTTDEGTWLHLDVSTDGKTGGFDSL